MIRLAGTGVALHAKPAVAAEADVRIDHGDLTALLYIQGYRGRISPHEADPHTTRLILRNWEERDRDLLSPHQLRRPASWSSFRSAATAPADDVLMDRLRAGIAERRLWLHGGRNCRDRRMHRLRRPASRPISNRSCPPAQLRSAGGSRRNIGATAMSPRPPRPSRLRLRRLDLEEIVSFAVRNNAAQRRSWSAWACVPTPPAISTTRMSLTHIRSSNGMSSTG